MKYRREGGQVVPVIEEEEPEPIIIAEPKSEMAHSEGPRDPHDGGPTNQFPLIYQASQSFFDGLPSLPSVLQRYDRVIAKAKAKKELKEVVRLLGKRDRFFFFTRILNRKDGEIEYVYKMCRLLEYMGEDNIGDFWAREHYKSSLKNYAGNLQRVVNDPTHTIGMFGYTKQISMPFLMQVKNAMETNKNLKYFYDDVFYENPETQSPQWSSRDGLIVKRKGDIKEPTFEAHGLVRNQPTGLHLSVMSFDDIVDKESVSSKSMTEATFDSWRKSLNLVDTNKAIRTYAGTFWSYSDAWQRGIAEGVLEPRIAPATFDGSEDGEPVMWTKEQLAQKRRFYGAYNFACQILLDPLKKSKRTFEYNWLQYWDNRNLSNLNVYILVDPASEKKTNSDYTAAVVVGFGADGCARIIALLQDRFSLTERTRLVFELHKRYKAKAVYYEKYGKDSDIEHIQYVQRERNYSFPIFELGGKVSKEDRILRMVPWFENGRVFLPTSFTWETSEGTREDMVQTFIKDQYLKFPFRVTEHDDLFDVVARIADIRVSKPDYETANDVMADYVDNDDRYNPKNMKWEAIV